MTKTFSSRNLSTTAIIDVNGQFLFIDSSFSLQMLSISLCGKIILNAFYPTGFFRCQLLCENF